MKRIELKLWIIWELIYVIAWLFSVKCNAQPDLRLVLANEYGPGFKGMIGGDIESFATTYLYSNQLDWTSSLPMPGLPADKPHLILRFPVDIVNLGDAPFRVGNAWIKPANYIYLAYQGVSVRNLVSVSLCSTNGAVVRERLLELHMMWDCNPAIPGLPSFYRVFDVAISPGRGASSGYYGSEYLSGTLLDITGVPSGVYELSQTLDPVNVYGSFDASKTIRAWVKITDMEVVPTVSPMEFPVAAKPLPAKPSWVTPKPTVRPPSPPTK